MPREVKMAATTEWYKGLATQIQKREHAELMISKWQEKLNTAEAEIARMTAEAQAQGYGAPEQGQE